MPADTFNQGALAEELSAMDAQHSEEQVVAHAALVPVRPLAVDDRGDDRVDLALDSVNGSQTRVDIPLNAMPCDQRDVVFSSLRRARVASRPPLS